MNSSALRWSTSDDRDSKQTTEKSCRKEVMLYDAVIYLTASLQGATDI